MDEEQTRAEIWQTVQALNRLWTVENRPGELARYFHKNMVAFTPTDRLRVEGQKACVAGWKAFSDNARIHYWKEIDPRIELFGGGQFTVVTYYYDMSFEMGGQTIELGGRDMFALVKEDGKWLAVADQFSPYPPE